MANHDPANHNAFLSFLPLGRNVALQLLPRIPTLRAHRKILAGEEILFNYGSSLPFFKKPEDGEHAATSEHLPTNEAADASDARRLAGAPLGPLDGVPLAIKDNLCTRGVRTTCASRALEDFVPPYDATAVRRLVSEHGAVMMGKTNMDEFAMGSGNIFSHFGPVVNPWSPNLGPRPPPGSPAGRGHRSGSACRSGHVPRRRGEPARAGSTGTPCRCQAPPSLAR